MEEERYTILFKELIRLESETRELAPIPRELDYSELEAIAALREIVNEAPSEPNTTFTTT